MAWRRIIGPVLVLGAVVPGLLPGAALAQSGVDRPAFEEGDCAADPHSEECICGEVSRFRFVPVRMETNAGGDVVAADDNGNGHSPVRMPDGSWVSGNPTPTPPDSDPDLKEVENDTYNAHCSNAYLRENMRRMWIFAVALAGGFAAISFAWGGVVMMQNGVSGVDFARSRVIILRVALGLLIVGLAYVIWQAFGDMVFGDLFRWSFDRNQQFTLD